MQEEPAIRHSGGAIIGTQLRLPGRLARKTNVANTRMPGQDQRMTPATEGFSSPRPMKWSSALQQAGPATSVNDQAWLILAWAGGAGAPFAPIEGVKGSRGPLFF